MPTDSAPDIKFASRISAMIAKDRQIEVLSQRLREKTAEFQRKEKVLFAVLLTALDRLADPLVVGDQEFRTVFDRLDMKVTPLPDGHHAQYEAVHLQQDSPGHDRPALVTPSGDPVTVTYDGKPTTEPRES